MMKECASEQEDTDTDSKRIAIAHDSVCFDVVTATWVINYVLVILLPLRVLPVSQRELCFTQVLDGCSPKASAFKRFSSLCWRFPQ